VETGEPLLLRTGDDRTHAIRAEDELGRVVFNVAVTATADSTLLRLHEPAGVLSLGCVIHRGAERPGRLVVVEHPFFARTGADGRFRFEGLPRGRIVLRVLDAELGEAERTVEVPSREPVALAL
jgi:hypothetical protein